MTVAETIQSLTKTHLDSGYGLLFGQCITAVGWIQHTVPPGCPGLVELPMSDVSGPGIAVGAALMGRRPILVLRFQSFLWLAASPIVNYAAKSMDIWGVPCPLLIRAIATEGNGAGPVHSNCFHSVFAHMPGLTVLAPMTPSQYRTAWDEWLSGSGPVLMSEHRTSYQSDREFADTRTWQDADSSTRHVTVIALSASQFRMEEVRAQCADEGIELDIIYCWRLKPFVATENIRGSLETTGCGLVIDAGFEICGIARSIAYELTQLTGYPVMALGQADRSSGVAPRLENGTPSVERIVEAIHRLIQRR